jgi:hypothetical protein
MAEAKKMRSTALVMKKKGRIGGGDRSADLSAGLAIRGGISFIFFLMAMKGTQRD